MALNFALQELGIYYNNIYELRLEEGKENKGFQLLLYNYYYCDYIVTFFNPSSLSGDQTSTYSRPVQI